MGMVNMSKKSKQAEAVTPEVTPAAPATPVQPEEKKAAEPVAVSKQQLAVMQLVVGLKQERQIEVKAEQLVQDGKFINVTLPGWPVIAIGPSGGYNLPQVKSYPKADLATMLTADARYAKQLERETKKTAAPAAAAVQPEVKQEEAAA